jgi:large subunit ribosomal protein L18
MRPIHKPKTRAEKRHQRHLRVRKKVSGTAERPRLVVYRSIKHIYAQLVDDGSQRTILTVSDQGLDSGKKTERSAEVGKRLAAKAKDAGITKVVFDRAGYRYHGRVKAVADGAREGGLEF